MILNNLDEIYQEVLEELSYRVGIINLQNKKHVDMLSEILETSEVAVYKSDILGELYKNVITEIEFQDKSAYLAYKDKHKMRPSTKETIGDKAPTVVAVSNTYKEKKADDDGTKKAVKNLQSKGEKSTLGDLGVLAGLKAKMDNAAADSASSSEEAPSAE